MRYRSTLVAAILLLLSIPNVNGQYDEWPIMFETLKGFDITYHVAMQTLGVNPQAKRLNVQGGLSVPNYDFRIWVWQSSFFSWTFKNVDIINSWYFVYDVCTDPVVEGIFFEFTDGRRHVLYPQRPVYADAPEKGLIMHMLQIETWHEQLTVQGCKEDKP